MNATKAMRTWLLIPLVYVSFFFSPWDISENIHTKTDCELFCEVQKANVGRALPKGTVGLIQSLTKEFIQLQLQKV